MSQLVSFVQQDVGLHYLGPKDSIQWLASLGEVKNCILPPCTTRSLAG